jgi:flagellar hook-length control protein FliK
MVKTLSLQLEPDDLGSVVITMRLSASGLDLQVAVAQPQAMQVIEKDKDALSDALRSTGYTVGTLDVTAAQASNLNAGGEQSAQGQAGDGQAAQSNSTFTTSQGGDGSAYDHSASRENRQGAASPRQDRDSSNSAIPLGGDLYV